MRHSKNGDFRQVSEVRHAIVFGETHTRDSYFELGLTLPRTGSKNAIGWSEELRQAVACCGVCGCRVMRCSDVSARFFWIHARPASSRAVVEQSVAGIAEASRRGTRRRRRFGSHGHVVSSKSPVDEPVQEHVRHCQRTKSEKYGRDDGCIERSPRGAERGDSAQ